MTLGAKIRNAREDLDLSQYDVKLAPRYLLSLDEFEFISAKDLQLLSDVKILIAKNQ